MLETFGYERGAHGVDRVLDTAVIRQPRGPKVSSAAEAPGGLLHVDAAVAAQADAQVAVVGFKKSRNLDALNLAQMLNDLLRVFAVGSGGSEHRVVDDRPAVASVFFELQSFQGGAEHF